MSKYGLNPRDLVWITGPIGYAKMVGLDEVTTLEKYGAGATVLTGELGRLDGIPIIPSEHIREDVNSSGYYDVTNKTDTMIILAWVPGFFIGDRRKVTLKTFEDVQTDQTILVVTQRAAFNTPYSTGSNGIVNSAIDVANS